uniref:Uncharacterized protein n=1 Tax=Melopsittacus undulatus TaxID=13146 RepID=A0A8C6JLC2_MELUD
ATLPQRASLVQVIDICSKAPLEEEKHATARHGCLYELTAATNGSAGVDLAVARTVTISTGEVTVVDSTATGPLGGGLSALLIGRSSSIRQGIFVMPGLIDADYEGIIKIMIKVFASPVTITQGSRIAQLIPFFNNVQKLVGDIQWIRTWCGITN